MKKSILIIFLWFIYTMPIDSVMAHTYLQKSVPNHGEVVTEPISELLLIFETKIENGSTLELVNHSKGSTIIPEQITVETSQMKARLFPALANGEYTVKWKVIGADGHIIQGEYSFMIDVPNNPDEQKSNRDGIDIENQEELDKQNETSNSEDTPNQEQDEAAATDKKAVDIDDAKSNTATGDNKTDKRSPIPILLGILGILAGIGLLFRFMKGR